MKIDSFFYTLFFVCLFCACEKEDSGLIDADLIEISATISSISSSRAELSPEGTGYFSIGDCIQLFIFPERAVVPSDICKLTLSEDGWIPRLTWREIHAERVVFTATYPALAEELTVHTIAADQRTRQAYEQSDLLLANINVVRKQSVSLSFAHVLSRLSVTLSSSDGSFTDDELASARISIKSGNRIAVNVAEATIEENVGEVVDVLAYHESKSTFRAILCPQEIDQSWKEESWIEIQIGDNNLVYKAPAYLENGTPFQRLEAGKELCLNIELSKKEEENWANRTVWIHGVCNPPVDTWGYAFLTEKILGLKWNPEYGWYDCNKLDPNKGGVDSDMCWAATVANMIHWWLDQNSEYIERYGRYTGPRNYNSSINSEVFDYYKAHFNNTGNDVSAALNWFFTGRFATSTKPDGAFFKEVMGTDPVVRITRFGERSLTQEIQKAIKDKEVIGCTIQYPTYLHAISLWGADFDSNGEVCAIYISDSNDRWLDEQVELWPPQTIYHQTPAGIIRKRVQKKADGVYMESSVPGYYTFKIEELNLINLMEDKWNEYFSSH